MKIYVRKHRVAPPAFHRRGVFRPRPCSIIKYREFIKQFNLILPESGIELIGGGYGFCHVNFLYDLLAFGKSRNRQWSDITNSLRKNNILTEGLAIMGVYHNPNLRGKQWVCSLTINKVKSITTHATEKEAIDHLYSLKDKVDKGLFIEEFEREPLVGAVFGPCIVDEGKAGERCSAGTSCNHYKECLNEACKLDIKGWRIHDTAATRDA